jgi:hypothetical protein
MGIERRSGQGQGQQRRAKRENDRNGVANINLPSPKEVQASNGRTPQGRQNQHTAPSIVPDHDEVLGAVESLYRDQLKPFGRILRKRIAERVVGGFIFSEGDAGLPDVDIKHLRNVCATSEQLTIVPEEGGDWSAHIRGRQPDFVNVYSPVDTYDPELWEQIAQYLLNLSEDEMCLPGGRYSCAQALAARSLPFLTNRSLGEVCHIVQLAISQKRLLGYFSGAVVPYSRSQSMVKEWCAYKGAPCTSSSPAANPITSSLSLATWDEARENLRAILDSVAVRPNPGVVPLSNVKRLFRSRYQVELSETMLGYSKLSELLQDQRMNDICTVQLQGHGYIVVQNLPPQSPTSRAVSLANALPNQHGGEPLRVGAAADSVAAGPMLGSPQPLYEASTPQPRTLAMRSSPLTVDTAVASPISSQTPCRVEIGCDSPLRPQNWARGNPEREMCDSPEASPHWASSPQFRGISPHESDPPLSPSPSPYPRNRVIWPATPDRSPARSPARYPAHAAYELNLAGGMLGPPSLNNVHGVHGAHGGLVPPPASIMAPSVGLGADNGPEEEDEEEDDHNRQKPDSNGAPGGLSGASPTALPSTGAVFSREDVRMSSPKRGNANSSSTESTTADYSPARSPARNPDFPATPTLHDEPMKVKVMPNNIGSDSSLGGGRISGSLSPTRSKVRSQEDKQDATDNLGFETLLCGLPGQPQSPAVAASTTDRTRWNASPAWKPRGAPVVPKAFFQAEIGPIDETLQSFVQTPPPLGRGVGADLSPKKGALAESSVLHLANLV